MLDWGWKLFYTTQITMTLINDGNSRKRERFQILCECNSGCHLSLSIRKESPIVEALARLLWVPIDVVPAHRVFSSFRPNHLCELKTKFYHSVRASHPATLISNLNAPEILLFIFWAQHSQEHWCCLEAANGDLLNPKFAQNIKGLASSNSDL